MSNVNFKVWLVTIKNSLEYIDVKLRFLFWSWICSFIHFYMSGRLYWGELSDFINIKLFDFCSSLRMLGIIVENLVFSIGNELNSIKFLGIWIYIISQKWEPQIFINSTQNPLNLINHLHYYPRTKNLMTQTPL